MSIWERLGFVSKAKANSVVDQLENPTEISKQVIREYEEKLNEAISAAASVQATNLQAQTDVVTATNSLKIWEEKVNKLLDKIDNGDTSSEIADISKQAASKYHEAEQNLLKKKEIAKHTTEQVDAITTTIGKLQEEIINVKDKAHDIEARQKVADATLIINKAMSSTNTDGLNAIITRMENKVQKTEFAGQAWADVSGSTTVESKIDKLLNSTTAEDTLAEFRKKRSKI